jgi:hypothetical protein
MDECNKDVSSFPTETNEASPLRQRFVRIGRKICPPSDSRSRQPAVGLRQMGSEIYKS